MDELLAVTENGLYAPAGGFFIDPWRPVDRAVITHAHSDHARPGSARYLTCRAGERLLRLRVGPETPIETLEYGETLDLNGVQLSFHPAGHILGSAHVRLERRGETWVVSGDYKLAADPTCAPFEAIRCHTFVTESTFGLPIYRWPDPAGVFDQLHQWWRSNQESGRASLLYGYSVGKAQRLLAGLDPSIGPILTHGAVEHANALYRAGGVALPETALARDAPRSTPWSQALILAPPLAHGSPWSRRFGPASSALASGWMRLRGTRRRRAMDRGFVLSDHADWPALLAAIEATGAQRVGVSHGYVGVLVRWLRELGKEAWPLPTPFQGEADDGEEELAQA